MSDKGSETKAETKDSKAVAKTDEAPAQRSAGSLEEALDMMSEDSAAAQEDLDEAAQERADAQTEIPETTKSEVEPAPTKASTSTSKG